MNTPRKLAAIVAAGGLALGLAACEAEGDGTSPGIEDGGVGTEPGMTGTDPLAPADDTGMGEG